MRYGIFSDVHANLPALACVLEELRRRDVDRYVCAGDVIGYGPHPEACVATVSALSPEWVLGNHELMLLGRLPMESASPLARRSLEWTRGVLPSWATQRLQELPLTRQLAGGVVLAHGSLTSANTRVQDRPGVRTALDQLARLHPDARVLVLGHTHRVMLADPGGARRWAELAPRLRLEQGCPYVLNPGSVGQSRGFTGRARAAVLDTDEGTLELLALRYETTALVRDLAAAGLPTWSHHRSPLRRIRERAERKARRWLRAARVRRAESTGG